MSASGNAQGNCERRGDYEFNHSHKLIPSLLKASLVSQATPFAERGILTLTLPLSAKGMRCETKASLNFSLRFREAPFTCCAAPLQQKMHAIIHNIMAQYIFFSILNLGVLQNNAV